MIALWVGCPKGLLSCPCKLPCSVPVSLGVRWLPQRLGLSGAGCSLTRNDVEASSRAEGAQLLIQLLWQSPLPHRQCLGPLFVSSIH